MKFPDYFVWLVSLVLVMAAAIIYGPDILSVILSFLSALLLLRLVNTVKESKGKKPLSILFLIFIFPSMFLINTELSVVNDMLKPKGPRSEISGKEILIVPGAAVNGLEPSPYLKARLDGALAILSDYPKMIAIVSGGKGAGKDYSESYVMKNYLTTNGIKAERIIEEDKSTSTFTNFQNSKKIIQDNLLGNNIIVVTNSFHNLRTIKTAEFFGFNVIPAPVISPLPFSRIYYAIKESLSFGKYIIEKTIYKP